MQFFKQAMAISAIAFSCSSFAVTANAALTLSEAVRATLAHNPELTGYPFRASALEGEKQTASLDPEIRVSADLENLGGSGPYRETQASELTISLSSALELGDQRDARVNVVTARQQQLASSQRVMTLDVVMAVTQQFIRVLSAQEQLVVQQESHQLIQKTLKSLDRLVQAGRLSESESLRGTAALTRATIKLQQARQNVDSERIRLSAFWADPTPDFSIVSGDLYRIQTLLSLPAMQEKLSRNPDLLMLAEEVNVRKAEIKQARSESRPALAWSAGVRRFQGEGDSAMVIGMSMPLGSGDRAKGAIASANANQQRAELEQSSAYIRLQAELSAAYETHRQAADEVRVLKSQVITALKQAIRIASEGFDLGRYSYLEFSLAQKELLDTQLAIIDAASRVQETRIELERMIGSTLTEENFEVKP